MMPNRFMEFIKKVEINLAKPLPGMDAQYQMAPVTRKEQLVYNSNDIPPRESAVLALLYPDNEEVMLVLMKRASGNSVHSGQISFPGGQAEAFDKDAAATALRETEEETGIDRNKISIIGKLSEVYISPSNFNVIPFVGYLEKKPDFKPNEEVERIITAAISDFQKPEAKTVRRVTTSYAINLEAPCFVVDGEILWGATAMMINELLVVIGKNRQL